MTGYVELQASTNFSFLHGASHPEEMFATASLQGHTALGIADRHTVAGIVRAHTAARTTGVRLIPGCRLDLTDGTPLLAYPKDLPAWGRLCRMLGLAGRRGERGDFVLGWEDLAQAPGLILILLDGEPDEQTASRLRCLGGMLDARGDPPGRHDGHLSLSLRQRQGDRRRLRMLGALACEAGIRTVVTGDVLYHEASRSRLQDAVTAIRNRVTLEELGAAREAHRDRYLRSPDEMERMYRGFEDALARTTEIASRCAFSVAELRYQYPSETDDGDETPQAALTRLVNQALPERYPSGAPEPVARQITHELDLVASLDYASYFLTVHAIVRQARSMGILCQGRGSAANSVICYILGITAIDPVRSGLLFERFISAERREPPDIDVDFESDRREEIIQWIYRRYGRGHAALCATVMRYQPKGALRDAGKVMGLSEDLLAQMSKHLASALTDDEVLVARAKEIGLDLTEWRLRLTIELARQLLGVPRQLGTHPGGFVLTRDRLDDLVALQPAAMEDRQIIVWDKDDIDALGFMKVDILGLGMLGCLRRAFELLAKHRGHRLDMATIPAEDPDTYAMIRKADTLGTFQIESRAQMSMLPRLKPTTFYDLVVQVAIVRPGPIQGDMVHPYLRRREGTEPVHFPRPELRRVLGKTLGVPLFQEQAMQVAIQCAGFTPGEADQLRRSMSTFKLTGGVSHFRDKLIEGMVGNGYDRDFAERTFSQLEGFGSYGFPESHAASFALIAYASSYIKCHHPEVFCAALLNAQPMGFYAPAQIVRDAREHRVAVRRIDINRSHWDCTLETGDRPGALVVRLGMRLVKGLANADAARLIASRMPLYESIDDVWRRGGVPAAAIERLAEADAFQGLGIERRAALWDIKGLADTPLPLFAAADRGRNRFEPEFLEPLPSLPPMPDGREVIEDYRMTGLSLRRHPLAFLRERFDADGIASCEHIAQTRDGRRISIAGLVLMRQRPGSAKGVMFMTIEDETGIANIVIWKDRIERYRPAVVGSALIVCHGRVQREGDVTHIVADRFEDASPFLRQLHGDERPRPPHAAMPQARDFR